MSTTRIMVVDDEPAFTRMIKFALEDTGEFEVRVENDPLQAQEAAHRFVPDIVVLDIIMPGMSGLELAEQFRGDSKLAQTPIVFLTAAVSREHPHIHHDLLEDCPVLVKPVSSEDLVACIGAAARP